MSGEYDRREQRFRNIEKTQNFFIRAFGFIVKKLGDGAERVFDAFCTCKVIGEKVGEEQERIPFGVQKGRMFEGEAGELHQRTARSGFRFDDRGLFRRRPKKCGLSVRSSGYPGTRKRGSSACRQNRQRNNRYRKHRFPWNRNPFRERPLF